MARRRSDRHLLGSGDQGRRQGDLLQLHQGAVRLSPGAAPKNSRRRGSGSIRCTRVIETDMGRHLIDDFAAAQGVGGTMVLANVSAMHPPWATWASRKTLPMPWFSWPATAPPSAPAANWWSMGLSA